MKDVPKKTGNNYLNVKNHKLTKKHTFESDMRYIGDISVIIYVTYCIMFSNLHHGLYVMQNITEEKDD